MHMHTVAHCERGPNGTLQWRSEKGTHQKHSQCTLTRASMQPGRTHFHFLRPHSNRTRAFREFPPADFREPHIRTTWAACGALSVRIELLRSIWVPYAMARMNANAIRGRSIISPPTRWTLLIASNVFGMTGRSMLPKDAKGNGIRDE